jgi:hypothetical protein
MMRPDAAPALQHCEKGQKVQNRSSLVFCYNSISTHPNLKLLLGLREHWLLSEKRLLNVQLMLLLLRLLEHG